MAARRRKPKPIMVHHEEKPQHAKLLEGGTLTGTLCVNCFEKEFPFYEWKRRVKGGTLEFHECAKCGCQYKVFAMSRGLF